MFVNRHVGVSQKDEAQMLNEIGVNSISELIEKTIPSDIKLNQKLNLPEALSERDYLDYIKILSQDNKMYKTYIGQGYYGTLTPPVILRNVLENPGWYTAYTPYQAEISQGRLEALLNFQTMVVDLTGMELANASLLDEATAVAEAMLMLFKARSRKEAKAGKIKFFVDENTFLQTKEVLKTRAMPLGIELIFGDYKTVDITDEYFGALVQFPNASGSIENYRAFANQLTQSETKLVVSADLLSLVLLKAPGEWGADVVVGTTQRFGVPLGYGGPHAAYFATKEAFKRQIPGRIIGVSIDKSGKRALRMALQTREQHIKRDKATSNICTAQALLAVMAGMYAVYHGANGLINIAKGIHQNTTTLYDGLKQMGYEIENDSFFDTITLNVENVEIIKQKALENEINLFYTDKTISISLDETTKSSDVEALLKVFSKAKNGVSFKLNADLKACLPNELTRKGDILQDEVFNSYHSETEMMRYLKRLENKDLSLVHSMISLGSCTMKLNAASQLMPITWAEFANIHPFVPTNQAQGFQKMIDNLEEYLCEITGFHSMSLQPNSGAQGEYSGLMTIRSYHLENGQGNRNVCLIPSSAHGTNPSSAVMAGMKIVVVKCDEKGNINVEDLKEKAQANKDNLSALMVTYPSTHGVYESAIKQITQIIHQNGGLVYMDGANMNAQVGLTHPFNIGADVCHLNLHKTFAIPHGGGGPGMGPIGVVEKLAPFLPSTNIADQETTVERQNIVSSAPWGSALILLISYGYIRMLGEHGLTKSTKMAILNANYMKARLKNSYDILYQGENNTVAHEMIVDCRSFKKDYNIEVVDIAKRLIDYGFHAPTVSFPVAGTLMIEPTESESKAEIDRFCEAMIQIKREIEQHAEGNPILKNAPHTAEILLEDEWDKPYPRKQAAYPLGEVESKYWAPVQRIEDAYGDRNLICTCTPISDYE